MTHDELLAKIESRRLHPGQDITKHSTWKHKAKLADVIRAVVELHKPDLITYSDGSGCECGNEFPCPTIQAIEKELN